MPLSRSTGGITITPLYTEFNPFPKRTSLYVKIQHSTHVTSSLEKMVLSSTLQSSSIYGSESIS